MTAPTPRGMTAPTAAECQHLSVRFETVTLQPSTSALSTFIQPFQRTRCADCGAIRLATGDWRMPNATAAEREGAASPRCVFCGKRKELREMDGVWLCPGPHEAIALDQLAALRNARDYWQGEANAATAALLAARADADALRAALQDIGEATVTHDPEPFRNRVIAILAALAATPEGRSHA